MRWKSLIGQRILVEAAAARLAFLPSIAWRLWAGLSRRERLRRLRAARPGRGGRRRRRAEPAGRRGLALVGGAGLVHGGFRRLDLIGALGGGLGRSRADRDVVERLRPRGGYEIRRRLRLGADARRHERIADRIGVS